MVATGEGAHYPMLTFAIGGITQNYPDNLKDVGFFAMPGDDAASNGLTVWMPAAVYIAKTTQHPEQAKRFVAFIASTKGCDVRSAANGATGPYLIKDCTLPADVPPAVADLLPYFQKDGATAPPLSSCRRSRGLRLSRSPSKSAPESARRPTAPRYMMRTSRSRRSSWDCLAGSSERTAKGPDLSGWRVPVRSSRCSMVVSVATARMKSVATPRRVRFAGKRTYPTWFFVPAAIIYGVLFLVPTFASFFFSPDPLDPLGSDLYRPRQFRAVLQGAIPSAGAAQHADLWRRDVGTEGRSSAFFSPCCSLRTSSAGVSCALSFSSPCWCRRSASASPSR